MAREGDTPCHNEQCLFHGCCGSVRYGWHCLRCPSMMCLSVRSGSVPPTFVVRLKGSSREFKFGGTTNTPCLRFATPVVATIMTASWCRYCCCCRNHDYNVLLHSYFHYGYNHHRSDDDHCYRYVIPAACYMFLVASFADVSSTFLAVLSPSRLRTLSLKDHTALHCQMQTPG